MKVLIILAIVGYVAALPQSPLAVATREPDFICKDGGVVPNPKVLEGIVKCKSEATNPKCEYKCVAKIFNLLESSGLPSRATYARWAKETFPETLQDLASKHFMECLDKHESKLDLADPNCEELSAFSDCTWALQPKLKC